MVAGEKRAIDGLMSPTPAAAATKLLSLSTSRPTGVPFHVRNFPGRIAPAYSIKISFFRPFFGDRVPTYNAGASATLSPGEVFARR